MAALRRADADLAATIPDLPRIVAFRNMFICGYATVDDELVWGRVEGDLPRLIEALTDERIAVYASINPSPPTVTPSCPVKTMKFINFASAAATNENAPLDRTFNMIFVISFLIRHIAGDPAPAEFGRCWGHILLPIVSRCVVGKNNRSGRREHPAHAVADGDFRAFDLRRGGSSHLPHAFL